MGLLPDVREADLGRDRVGVEERDELAVDRGIRLAEGAHCVAVVEAESPAVRVRSGAAATPREAAKGKDDVGGDVAVHPEQLAHAARRIARRSTVAGLHGGGRALPHATGPAAGLSMRVASRRGADCGTGGAVRPVIRSAPPVWKSLATQRLS